MIEIHFICSYTVFGAVAHPASYPIGTMGTFLGIKAIEA
jgi:hypothetical protein